MSYCRNCGVELIEGKRFCPECGEPTGESPVRAAASTPSPEYPVQKPKRKRKPIFKRWWFWVLMVIVASSLWNRSGGRANKTSSRRTEPVVTTAPRSTPRPTVKPTESPVTDETAEKEQEQEASAEPEVTPEPTETTLSQNEIRPEFKEYMDSYEEFMEEYIEFMEKYEKADSASAALMLVDYARLMGRYTDFAEKLDAMDESDYKAEWAYYMEVTNRVNQKLLKALG